MVLSNTRKSRWRAVAKDVFVLVAAVLVSWCGSAGAQPVNDDCQTATPVIVPGTIAVNLVAATPDTNGLVACAGMTEDVWYVFTAPTNGTLTITLSGLTPMTAVYVMSAGAGCPTDADQIECTALPSFPVLVLAGEDYSVRVSACGATNGTMELSYGLPAVEWIRGDCNSDGNVNLADAIYLIGNLFSGVQAPTVLQCVDAADANVDGTKNIADVVTILGALFGSPTVPLTAPYPACGPAPILIECLNPSCP